MSMKTKSQKVEESEELRRCGAKLESRGSDADGLSLFNPRPLTLDSSTLKNEGTKRECL